MFRNPAPSDTAPHRAARVSSRDIYGSARFPVIAVFPFLAVVLIAAAGVVSEAASAGSSGGTVEGTAHAPRVCFSKSDWGPAPDSKRPCVKITKLYEDGSFRVSVTDGDGTVRYSTGVGALDR